MNFVIAIISHEREKLFESKTLSFLKKHGICFEQVYVFVSDLSYLSYLPLSEKYGFNLLNSHNNLLKFNNNSILNARNNIINYFEDGANILEMDDDVDDIIDFSTDKGVENFIDLVNESFAKLDGFGLFGFSSQANKFFSNGIDKWGLYSIINSCLGYVNDKRIKLTVFEKEDMERCIQFYKLDLPILKRGNYGIKTRYWKNPGGIAARYSWEKRLTVQRESSLWLKKIYPEYCRIQVRKNGIYDLRFILKQKKPPPITIPPLPLQEIV